MSDLDRRLELDAIFSEMESVEEAYYQPTQNTQMMYPCITYKRDFNLTQHADNIPYRVLRRYLVTVIDEDPDSAIPALVEAMPSCVLDRTFVADNLNHWVYKLFF